MEFKGEVSGRVFKGQARQLAYSIQRGSSKQHMHSHSRDMHRHRRDMHSQ